MKRIDTDIETRVIELYENGETMKSIGLQLNLGPVSVKNILERFGIPIRSKGGKTKLPEELIVDLYKKQNSTGVLAKQFGVCVKTICDILKKHNVERNNPQGAFNLDRNYFKSIDRPDKAYFLGLLLTDGNVWGKQIRIELKSDDEYILNTFAKYIGRPEAKLHRRKGGYYKCNFSHLNTYCDQWVKDLAQWSVTPKKTNTAKMPILSEDMMPHLIRGIIDGDGYISADGSQIGICGANYENIKIIRDYLVKILNVKEVKILTNIYNVHSIIWGSKKDVLKIGEYIYKDKNDCYLKRKFDRWYSKFNSHVNPEVNE